MKSYIFDTACSTVLMNKGKTPLKCESICSILGKNIVLQYLQTLTNVDVLKPIILILMTDYALEHRKSWRPMICKAIEWKSITDERDSQLNNMADRKKDRKDYLLDEEAEGDFVIRQHVALWTQQIIFNLGWEVLLHTAYSSWCLQIIYLLRSMQQSLAE